MENEKSAIGLDGNVTALIGYIFGIVALVLIFIEKDNKFVRFHALQSILWFVAFFVAMFAVGIIGFILSFVISQVSATLGWVVGILTFLVYLVVALGFFGGWIFAAIKAFGNAETKLPIVGNLADKWA